MKIGCLQFAPQVGDIENNLNRADAVLSKADPQDLDLLVLPELAFTGFNFRSLQDISPFLEPSGSGITSLWARTMALKYNCNVSVGYPEKVDVSRNWPTGPEYYNSNIVVNADGETIANYRKSFLYTTDQKWALEGPGGFYDGWIPGIGNTAIGICMDINPYKFEAPWDAFEFAYHILESESNVVIVSMAWITREEPRSFSRMPQEPDMDTLTYWVTRLEPLIRSETNEEIIVIFCNRTGTEEEAIYAGTSAVLGIHQGEVKVYGLLGRGSKELLVVDTRNAPFARLVYRPDSVDGKANGDTSAKDDTVSQLKSKADVDKDSARVLNDSRDAAVADKASDTLTVGEHDKAISSTSLRRNTIPPVPPPAPTRPDEASLGAYKSPNMAPIGVPTRLTRSALSEISQRSLQSNESVESQASVQTVTTNPRPPEDSTPYPHSGLPPSGYPANSGERNKFYCGDLDNSGLDPFSPTTPFDDISPVHTNWQWTNPDSTRGTSVSGGGWMTGTPIGRHPEPFNWPVIQASRAVNDPENKGGQKSSEKARQNDATKETQQTDDRAGDHHITAQSQDPDKQNVVERPPSPKSRNASRSGRHERSNSTASQYEMQAAAIQHLESIARRARSRSQTGNKTAGIERQSTSRADNTTPNLFDRNKPGAPVIPTPAALDYYRSVSDGKAQRSRSGTRMEQPRTFSPSVTVGEGSVVRMPSRGRRLEPRGRAEPIGTRSSSADSTTNDVLHRRESARPGRPHNERHSSKTSHSNGQRRPSNGPRMQNFERVEAVLCPSCPVHGRRSESARVASHSSSSNEERPHERKRPDSVGDSVRSTATAQAGPSSLKHVAKNATEESTSITPQAPRQANLSADTKQIADATAHTPDRPSTAPLKFDPETPKAMSFDIREANSEPASAEPHTTTFTAS